MKRALLNAATLLAVLLGSTAALAQQPPGGTVRQQGQDVESGGTPGGAEGIAPAVQEPVDPAQAMRELVRDISKYARKFNRNFVVLTQGGLDLIEKVDPIDTTRGSPATTYMRTLDGMIVEGLNFHIPLEGKDEFVTEKKSQPA